MSSTAYFPSVSLSQETRPVLVGIPGRQGTDARASATVQLHPGGRLEFGYGVLGGAHLPEPVEFTVTAQSANSVLTLFHRQVDAAHSDVWHDASVDLGDVTGTATIEFTTSTPSATAGATGDKSARGFFADPLVTAFASEVETAPPPRNLIVISLDTLRADHLGLYGYDRDTSPNMDRLFEREGLVIEHFYSNAADTLHGHASMLTGRLPSTALEPRQGMPALAPYVVTLADLLRAQGYRTAAFTEDAYVAGALGFSRGFELYNENVGIETGFETLGQIETTMEKARNWILTHGNEPFFAFIHTYQVHAPYTPPARYREDFAVPPGATAADVDRSNYDREIRYTDSVVATFLDTIRSKDLLDHTLLVITADHGEEFGEHGRREHGSQLYDETVRVPLLLRAPGLLPAGVRRSGPMALFDLVPTLAQLLGLAIPLDLDGRGCADHLSTGTELPARAIYHEAGAPVAMTYQGMEPTWIPPSYAVTAWPWRVIRIRTQDGARYERYDLENDHAQAHNLYGASASEPVDTRPLADYQDTQARRRADLARRLGYAASPPPAAGILDESHRKKLEALGYLQ